MEKTEIRMSGKCHGIYLIQEGSRVIFQDLYRRRPLQTFEYADEKAAFAALCGLRAEVKEEMGNESDT